MKDVHTEHCCSKHGCKYGSETCTVTTGAEPQSHPCEMCGLESEGYFDKDDRAPLLGHP